MKIKDGIIGLIVGDALGVPVEFKRKEDLIKNPVTDMIGHGTYDMPKGTWSDDSSLTLATMQSIVNKKGIDYKDIMTEFSLFIHKDKYCQYYTFDYGNTTRNAIDRFDRGIEALKCGGSRENEIANGSLMRILPLAFINDIDYDTIENVSGITHAHKICKIACVLYIEIAKSMLENDLEIQEHIKKSCDKIKKHYGKSSELDTFHKIMENKLDDVESRAYVVGTLECVLHCLLTTSSYREAVLKAVNFGNDADTVGAICGGLAGIYYGFDSIPKKWINDIPQIDNVIKLCNQFEETITE